MSLARDDLANRGAIRSEVVRQAGKLESDQAPENGPAGWDVPSEGPLDGRELQRVRSLMQSAVDGNRQRLEAVRWSTNATDVDALLAEAQIAVDVEARAAEVACLDRGMYWTVKPGQRIPGEREGIMVFHGNSASKDGQTVDVVIPVVVQDHPHLRNALEHAAGVSRVRSQSIIERFNAKSHEERVRIFRAHEQAQVALREGPPREVAGDEDKMREWRAGLSSQLLPSNMKVHRGTFLMSLR